MPTKSDPPKGRSGGPERTCVVSREAHPQSVLLRLALLPDGTVAVDRSGRIPGRGAWITPDRASFEQLAKKPGVLLRALDLEGPPPRVDHLLDEARAATDAAINDLLSLAARSGVLQSGAESVEGAVRSGAAVALLCASDASEQSVARALGNRADFPCYKLDYDRDTLGHRIGKGPRAMAALIKGGPSAALTEQLRRRQGLR